MEDMVAPFIADGRLVQVSEDWSPPLSGYHHPSSGFAALLEELLSTRAGTVTRWRDGQLRP
jgi:hypothetical protein